MQGLEIVFFGPADLDRLMSVTPGLFDEDLIEAESRAFLADPSNMLALGFDGDLAVGMVSATVLRHPDKPPSLFVNEVGTREGWERRGIATALMQAMIAAGRARGCQGIWLGTDDDNEAAIGLYRSLGADEVAGVFFGWDDAL